MTVLHAHGGPMAALTPRPGAYPDTRRASFLDVARWHAEWGEIIQTETQVQWRFPRAGFTYEVSK